MTADEEDDREALLIRVSTPDAGFNERVLDQVGDLLDATGLGETALTCSGDHPSWTLLFEVDPKWEAKLESVVLPRARAVLEQLGLASQSTVEIAEDAGDDDEGWA